MSARIFKHPFAQIPEWVVYHADLSDRAVRLFAVLDRHASPDGSAFPARRRLAEILRTSIDSVDRAVKELVVADAVAVTVRTRDGGKGQTSNSYWLWPAGPHGCGPPGRTVAAPRRRAIEREPRERRTCCRL